MMNKQIVGYRLRYAHNGDVRWWAPFMSAQTAKSGTLFATKQEALDQRFKCNDAWVQHSRVVRVFKVERKDKP